MKNIKINHSLLLTFCLSLMMFGLTNQTQAQGQYESGMQQAFDLWTDTKPMEASAMFERIGEAEKDNWIPYYYAANTLISASFSNKDKNKVNEILKKAATFIADGHRLSPENPELSTLEGLLYTAYVAMDPGTYAMQYSNKIINLHDRALALDSENPRAHLNKIEYEMGTAKFFGEDMTQFCSAIKDTDPLFENQKTEIPFYPQYGADRVAVLLKQCNCK